MADVGIWATVEREAEEIRTSAGTLVNLPNYTMPKHIRTMSAKKKAPKTQWVSGRDPHQIVERLTRDFNRRVERWRRGLNRMVKRSRSDPG